MNENIRQALQYLLNTGESATIHQFDDDHEPIGPMLRRDIIPRYAREDANGILKLTDAGRAAVGK